MSNLNKKWESLKNDLISSDCHVAKKAGKAAVIGLAALLTTACATAPPRMDQPDNNTQRAEAFVKGAVLGAAVRQGNTKENVIAGVIVGGLSAIIADNRNKNAQESYAQLRNAGIQAIELPSSGRSNRVLLQTAPSVKLNVPIENTQQTVNFLNSVSALSHAINLYKPASYADVQVVLMMPTGCAREVTEVAERLQHYAHTQLNLPIAVIPRTNEFGKLSYEEAVNLRPTTRSAFSSRLSSQQSCEADATASISTVMYNVRR